MSKEATIQEETTEETTQESVEEVESQDVEQKPVVLERDRIIAEMTKRRRDQENPQEESEEETDEIEEESDESDEDEIIDLKVDGEVVPMTKKEVDSMGGIAEAQKSLSAEKRLKQASIERKRLEQAAGEQRQREQALRQREQELEQRLRALEEKAQGPEENDDEFVNKFVQSVYSGDEDEAKESLRSILKKIKSPQSKQTQQIDEGAILNKALYEVEKRNGQREFTEKYPHLKQDKFLFEKTNHETVQLMEDHPEWSPRDIIIEAAKRVDSWYKEKIGDKGTDTLKERTKSKQKTEPIQSAQTRKKTDSGYQKQTKDDIFEMYRKSRAK